MKKYLFPAILTLLLILPLLTGCSAVRTLDAAEDRIDHTLDTVEDRIEQHTVQPTPTPVTPASVGTGNPTPTPEQITQAEAIEIALQHAGFDAASVQYLHTEYEIDDGIPQYDVSFHVDRWEYEYEIHAESGQILSFERDD